MTSTFVDIDDAGLEILTDDERAEYASYCADYLADWNNRARTEQLPPPGNWLVWLLITGRRWGKTRAAAEWMRQRVFELPGFYGICAPTFSDTRDVCVEGGSVALPSGFLSVCKPGEVEKYNRSQNEITMSNGSKIKMLSADEPDRARGWGFHSVWCDEFSSWRYPDTWYLTLLPATTMADDHRFVVTTTPKPNLLTKALLKQADERPDLVRLVRGRTVDNAANLGEGAVAELERSMTQRQVRQELYGELLEDLDGALWRQDTIDKSRVHGMPDPDLIETVVTAIDPAGTSHEHSDETGIIVAARTNGRCPKCGPVAVPHAYVYADRSGRYTPAQVAHTAIRAHDDYLGDRVVAETNFGADWIESGLRAVDPSIPYKTVHASRGKVVRAQPVAALYEQARVHHVGTDLDVLESQLCEWTPGDKSPDRLDALVWALTELLLGEPEIKRGGVVW